jgi:hypothetical protein
MSAPENEFEKASRQKHGNLITEFWDFLKQNKKIQLFEATSQTYLGF